MFALRSWRSETFTAFANRHEFPTFRHHHTQYLVSELTTLLSIFVPRADKNRLAASIRTVIVEPALVLAHKFHLAVNKYSLEWTELNRSHEEERSHDPKTYVGYECVDLLRAGTIRPQAVAAAGAVTYLFDVSPALVLETVRADALAEPKVLHRPRVLIATSKDAHSPFMPRLYDGDEQTIMGWLSDKLHWEPRNIF
jgi:hypothetical protein